MLPFSRQVMRLAWLKRSLAVYRLAFGQLRQDDLLDYLQMLVGPGMDAVDLADLQIRLEPENSRPMLPPEKGGELPGYASPSLTESSGSRTASRRLTFLESGPIPGVGLFL